MTWTTIVSVAALSVVFLICSVLMVWCEYDDGLFGKSSLFLVWLGTFAFLANVAHGIDFVMPVYATSIHLGMALFMVRHVWRFLQFRKRKEAET